MQISMKCSLAVHCLIFMHEAQGVVRVTSSLLSESTGSNAVTIRTIVAALRRAGFVRTERGGSGGVELVRDAAEITLFDIYRAVDSGGIDSLIKVHDCGMRACPVAHNIAGVLEGPYRKIEEAVRDAMRTVTLADMIDDFHKRLADSPEDQALVAANRAAAMAVASS